MALNLTVGVLAHIRRYSPDRLHYYDEQFNAINRALAEQGLPEHHEPDALEAWTLEMYGHSGLHTLQRIAAHLWAGNGVPEPVKRGVAGVPDVSSDPVMTAYYDEVQAWLRGGAPRHRMAYEHLILHSDDRGYYLPFRFPQVIFTHPSLNIAGTMIGSAPVLMDECRQILGVLAVPPDLDLQDEALHEAVSNPGRGEGWQRYGIEIESCLKLLTVCQHALDTSAALVFM